MLTLGGVSCRHQDATGNGAAGGSNGAGGNVADIGAGAGGNVPALFPPAVVWAAGRRRRYFMGGVANSITGPIHGVSAASLLGNIGYTTVASISTYSGSIASREDIYGPFEAGFGA